MARHSNAHFLLRCSDHEGTSCNLSQYSKCPGTTPSFIWFLWDWKVIGRCMVLWCLRMSIESGATKLASCFLCSALDIDQKTKDLGGDWGVTHFKGHSHIIHIFIIFSPACSTCCSLSDSNAAGAKMCKIQVNGSHVNLFPCFISCLVNRCQTFAAATTFVYEAKTKLLL